MWRTPLRNKCTLHWILFTQSLAPVWASLSRCTRRGILHSSKQQTLYELKCMAQHTATMVQAAEASSRSTASAAIFRSVLQTSPLHIMMTSAMRSGERIEGIHAQKLYNLWSAGFNDAAGAEGSQLHYGKLLLPELAHSRKLALISRILSLSLLTPSLPSSEPATQTHTETPT